MSELRLPPGLSRRDLFKLGAAGALAGTVPLSSARAAEKLKTKARIVVAGAGAAGLSMASSLARRLEGATITLVDARQAHYYQPGFTLIAGGLKKADYAVSKTAQYVADGVEWIEEAVAEFDPEGNRLITAAGRAVPYDYLVVATGMRLDYDAIEGMDTGRIGENGLGSHYAGPEAAAATWKAMARFVEEGGRGVFLRPATEMKCAGAPLKYTFITDDRLRQAGNRGKAELIYTCPQGALFSVPIVHEKVRMLYQDRGVESRYQHTLTAIDPGARRATFATPEGPREIDYDFINVIPPMRAPRAVQDSPLPWADRWEDQGWVEVDKHTMQHRRFANIWAVGDVAGVPKGKTAASVKWQVPVATDQIVAAIAGVESDSLYDGYTSCPLITQLGRAMLIEFDYNNNLTPSFPGIVAPLEELWITWVMKTIALKPTYIAMLRGEA